MTPHGLIDCLARLARLTAPTAAQIAAATGFDLSLSEEDETCNGLRIFRELRLPDGRCVELLYLPPQGEWTLVFREDSGDIIDPALRWGDLQTLQMSPTTKGYAILCRAPLSTILTASTPSNRLETISVRPD